ncbi:MAG: response regulator transcription factor [Campylobacteraceae bacterium]|nr:response regulator transcription factor [Campylobacteraceae bacterium]
MSALKILVLENEDSSNPQIIKVLEENGFDIEICKDDNEFLDSIYEKHYDLYLIGINENSILRFDLMKALNDFEDLTLKMVITSIPNTTKRSFLYGCDECVIKNIADEKEIILRIKALIRRQFNVYTDTVLLRKNIEYDIFNKRIFKDKHEIYLSEKPLMIIDYLLKFRGFFVSSESLETGVYPANSKSKNAAIRFHIHKIRQLFGNDIITSNRTNGYKINIKL